MSLSPHVPTPRTFLRLRVWKVDRERQPRPAVPGGQDQNCASPGPAPPVGRRRLGEQQPERPESLHRGVGTHGERAAAPAPVPEASSFPSLFPVLCSSAVKLSGEETERREKGPRASPGELPSWEGSRPCPALPTFPSLGEAARAPAPRLPAELRVLLHLPAPSGGRRLQ